MKPSTTKRLSYGTLSLTILAGLPYELGSVATVIPPSWKPWVVLAGLIAKMILDEIKTQQGQKVEDVATELAAKEAPANAQEGTQSAS